MAEITVTLGTSQNKYVFHQGEMTIGRTADCEIIIDNLAVSRKHAKLSREDDGFYVADLGSGNGTFVNGKRISKQRLSDNDEIVIGKHRLLFKEPRSDKELISKAGMEERTKLVGESHAAYLAFMEGFQEKMRFTIRKPKVTIGRSMKCDVQLAGLGVGRQHALLYRQGDEFLLKSTTLMRRTLVNDQPVKEAQLRDGDEIRIGKNRIIFGVSQEELPPADRFGTA